MDNSKILNGITILDFSHRLPGPLAGLVLAQMGAKVYKIEDQSFGDAFDKGSFADFDPDCFRSWYQSLNKGKEILKFNFKDPQAKNEILTLVKKSNGIIMGLPPKVQTTLGLDLDDLNKLKIPLAVINMGASKTGDESMHDLNAMAISGILSMHTHGHTEDVVDPPFLPVSGLSFGQKIATDLLGLILQAQKNKGVASSTTYLLETCQDLVGAFYPENLRKDKKYRFLHNGAFPCYSLYRCRDGKYLALAAVEEKFWNKFCEVFSIKIPASERFRRDQTHFRTLAKFFGELSSNEVMSKSHGVDVCLSLVD